MPKSDKSKKKQLDDEQSEEYAYDSYLKPETKRAIIGIFLALCAVLSILSLYHLAGPLGDILLPWLSLAFGISRWIFPLILAIASYSLLARDDREKLHWSVILGLLLTLLSLNALLHIVRLPDPLLWKQSDLENAGGYLGVLLALPFLDIMGKIASIIVLLAFILISLLLFFNTSLRHLGGTIFSWFGFLKKITSLTRIFRHRESEDEPAMLEEILEKESKNEHTENVTSKEMSSENMESSRSFHKRTVVDDQLQPIKKAILIPKKRSKIDLPLDLLNNKISKPTSMDLKSIAYKIQKTLANFDLTVELGEINIGPTVTQFTISPADGVKLSRITALDDDLALALAAHPVRIEAPIPGKSLVGIEVPNQTAAIVGIREILASEEFRELKGSLIVALGKDVAGRPWMTDLSSMPHLLIAGATGSGKTICINTLIISLLYQYSPDDLKLILIDPKRVELTLYNGIPHLMTPVITDVKKTINSLKWCIIEMERRFELLSKAHKRDIHSYNHDFTNKIPYIVLVIDELADLMATAANEVEGGIIRLAQMARAVGIHLILATQRPSVDVITGLIKANITARIAFAVASSIDSRTILDTSGAEKLLGRGDMLFVTAQLSKPVRLQGAFVSEGEVKRIVEYIKDRYDEPSYDTNVIDLSPSSNIVFQDGESDDTLYEEAKKIVIQSKKASASLLQRRLKIGYARAARLIDMLEDNGIVGPGDGAKPRELLVDGMDESAMMKGNEFTTSYDEEKPEDDFMQR